MGSSRMKKFKQASATIKHILSSIESDLPSDDERKRSQFNDYLVMKLKEFQSEIEGLKSQITGLKALNEEKQAEIANLEAETRLLAKDRYELQQQFERVDQSRKIYIKAFGLACEKFSVSQGVFLAQALSR